MANEKATDEWIAPCGCIIGLGERLTVKTYCARHGPMLVEAILEGLEPSILRHPPWRSRAPVLGGWGSSPRRGVMKSCKHETTYAIYRRGPRPGQRFLPDGQRCKDCGVVLPHGQLRPRL